MGVSLILFENFRRNRQESSRREDVSDRLNELEASEKMARKYYAEALVRLEDEVIKLREKTGTISSGHLRILPKPVWDLAEKQDKEDDTRRQGWLSWIPRFNRKDASEDETTSDESTAPGSTTVTHDAPDSPSLLSKTLWTPRSHPRDTRPSATEASAVESPKETPPTSKPSP